MKTGIRFIGFVKTATKKIPMAYLSIVEFDEVREQKEGVVLKIDVISKIMAYVWMDCDIRYFISTASSLSDGRP